MSNFKTKFRAMLLNRTFRIVLNSVYSIGASVVILGALFKIQHWNGAGVMLTAGLITEAIIFFIYAFEPQDEEASSQKDSENQPVLGQGGQTGYNAALGLVTEFGKNAEFETGGKFGIGANSAQGVGYGQSIEHSSELWSLVKFDQMLAESEITPQLLQNLGQGLKKLSESTVNLEGVADISNTSANFVKTIKRTDESLMKTAEAYEKVINDVILKTVFKYKGISHAMGNIEEGALEFHRNTDQISQNMQSLNSIYAQQKKVAESYLRNQLVCAEETQLYKEHIRELNQNLTELNQIYKGMIKAVKVK